MVDRQLRDWPTAWRQCLILMVIAVVVRAIGLSFGLPDALARPDEEMIVGNALRLETVPDWNPKFFSYPSLLIYTGYAGFKLLLYGMRFAGATDADSINALFTQNPAPFHLLLRVISVICGALTVPAVYLAARRLFGRRTALLASLIICLSYLHVRDSHFGVTDIPCVFLACVSFWQLTEYYQGRRLRPMITAAVFAGLAIGMKYTAAWLCLPFAVAIVCVAWRRPPSARVVYAFGASALAGALALVLFAVTTPYFFLDFATAWDHFKWEMFLLNDEPAIVAGINSFADHFRISLWYGLGWPVLLAALASGVWMAVRRSGRGLLLWSLPIAYYLFTGRSNRFFIRYMDILLPFLAIASAWGVRSLYIVLRRRRRSSLVRESVLAPRALPVFAVSLMLIPSVIRIAAFDERIGRTDTRSELRRWMLANVPPNEPVLWSGGWAAMPYMIHHRPIRRLDATERIEPLLLRDPGLVYTYRWIVLVDWPRAYYLNGRSAGERAFLASAMAGRYELVDQIDAYKADLPPDLCCALDHFYMSYQKPWIIERPGPGFRIYRRMD